MSGNFELLDFIGKPQGIVSAFGAIAAALGVVVTIFRVIRRLIRHKRTGKEAKTASADAGPTGLILLSRAALDRILPGAHSRLTRAGASAFLVGESLMRQDDIEGATRSILAKAPGALGQEAAA